MLDVNGNGAGPVSEVNDVPNLKGEQVPGPEGEKVVVQAVEGPEYGPVEPPPIVDIATLLDEVAMRGPVAARKEAAPPSATELKEVRGRIVELESGRKGIVPGMSLAEFAKKW